MVAERLLVDVFDPPVNNMKKRNAGWKTSGSSSMSDTRRAAEAVTLMNTENMFRNMAPKDKQKMERFIIIYIENVKHLRHSNIMHAFMSWHANIR